MSLIGKLNRNLKDSGYLIELQELAVNNNGDALIGKKSTDWSYCKNSRSIFAFQGYQVLEKHQSDLIPNSEIIAMGSTIEELLSDIKDKMGSRFMEKYSLKV